MAMGETAPPGIDISRPSIARVYDYMLGGKDNFAVDREAAEMALRIAPDGPEAAKANRVFLRRVVRYLAEEAGIRQFLDLGSGLPTQENVHEIAHSVDASIRVVYVDSDPMVLAHGRALLADEETTTVVQAEVREPGAILDHPEIRKYIDFSQPVALLMLGILHHFGDDQDPGGIAARLIDGVPPGSHVAISHFHDPGDAQPDVSKKAREVERIFNQTLGTGRWRTMAEIVGYFGELEILDPGVVPLIEWRPDGNDEGIEQTDTYYSFVGGLARKR
jgi:hypothetical protein